LEKTKGDTSLANLTTALEGLSWEGPRGTYYIRPSDHQVLLPAYIVKLTNITDPDYKYYELVKELGAVESAPPCALVDKYKDRCSMPMTLPASMTAGASATMAATAQ